MPLPDHQNLDPALSKKLFQAISKADTFNAKQLLQQHPELIHARGEKGITPLIASTIHRMISLCRFLIDQGADVNARSDDNQTAFMWAGYHDLFDMADMLCESGYDLNLQANDGTYLIETFICKCLDPVSGSSFFEWADERRYQMSPACKQAFQESKFMFFDLREPTEEWAQETKRKELVRQIGHPEKRPQAKDLIEKMPALLQDGGFTGQTPLTLASRYRDFELATWMLTQGADPHVFCEYSKNSLHYAFLWGDEPMVQTLLESGFNVNIRTHFGEYLLPKLVRTVLTELHKRSMLQVLDQYIHQMEPACEADYKKARLYRLLNKPKA